MSERHTLFGRCKIWIEKDGEKVFGDGPLDILHRVERTGSLRQAAEEINMSYSQAWNLIKDLENLSQYPYSSLKEYIDSLEINWNEFVETDDNTMGSQELACVSGSCEI